MDRVFVRGPFYFSGRKNMNNFFDKLAEINNVINDFDKVYYFSQNLIRGKKIVMFTERF